MKEVLGGFSALVKVMNLMNRRLIIVVRRNTFGGGFLLCNWTVKRWRIVRIVVNEFGTVSLLGAFCEAWSEAEINESQQQRSPHKLHTKYTLLEERIDEMRGR